MRIRNQVLVAMFAAIALLCEPMALDAQDGGRGRGGGGRGAVGGGGGRGGGGAGMSRPGGMGGGGGGIGRPGGMGGGGMPSMPSRPSGGGGGFGGSMGHMGGGGGGRPNVNRPQVGGGRPNLDRPGGGATINPPNINRPIGGGANVNRPDLGGRPNINRPPDGGGSLVGGNINRPGGRPNIDRPHGAMRPTIPLPDGGGRPTTRPGILPGDTAGRPSTRPGILPDVTPGRPSGPGSYPGLGGPNRPGGRPDRPSILPVPDRRPGDVVGGGNRPPTRPTLPPGTTPPGTTRPRPGRPSPDDIGDFIGIRPERPTPLPGVVPDRRPGTRPGRPGDIVGNRPGPNRPRPERPPFTRPAPPRPGSTNRGWWNGGNAGWGHRPRHNDFIARRPGWANIGNNVTININRNWQGSFRHPGWGTRPSFGHWNMWGNNFRRHWVHFHVHHNWFNQMWWMNHWHPISGWHYRTQFYSFPWSHWWRRPTWPVVTSWFTWTNAPTVVWQQPVFYTFGPSGNVQFVNNNVTVGGETVATRQEFAQSAAVLATVDPPASEAEAEQAEWLPLGTFAVTTSEKDFDSARSIQLALSRDGIISGTAFNADTGKAQTIQGRVDRETQRVAFRIGDNEDFVAETGIYNLTQDEAPLLVHFGTDKTEDWLLVRLDAPEDEDDLTDGR